MGKTQRVVVLLNERSPYIINDFVPETDHILVDKETGVLAINKFSNGAYFNKDAWVMVKWEDNEE